jgi:hypothetical protein
MPGRHETHLTLQMLVTAALKQRIAWVELDA